MSLIRVVEGLSSARNVALTWWKSLSIWQMNLWIYKNLYAPPVPHTSILNPKFLIRSRSVSSQWHNGFFWIYALLSGKFPSKQLLRSDVYFRQPTELDVTLELVSICRFGSTSLRISTPSIKSERGDYYWTSSYSDPGNWKRRKDHTLI